MASKNLFESLDELPTNTEAMKLINIATKLDFSGGLNKEKVLALNHAFSHNMIAKELLKLLIVDHLYKFNVEYKKRQEICDKLNISVQAKKNILIDKSKK